MRGEPQASVMSSSARVTVEPVLAESPKTPKRRKYSIAEKTLPQILASRVFQEVSSQGALPSVDALQEFKVQTGMEGFT
jgi:hypothetical protein